LAEALNQKSPQTDGAKSAVMTKHRPKPESDSGGDAYVAA
jgi:hypothetical protein